MAKITQIFALLFCCFHFACKEASFQLGSERMDQYLHLLEGKKVAVVGNQTSTIGQSHLVDTLAFIFEPLVQGASWITLRSKKIMNYITFFK